MDFVVVCCLCLLFRVVKHGVSLPGYGAREEAKRTEQIFCAWYSRVSVLRKFRVREVCPA